MARPIPLHLAPRDPRRELSSRLERAPLDHAEALLAAYELLQGLHDRGVLEVMRGTLGGGDKIIEQVVAVASGPEAIRALRNLLLLAKAFGEIDPALLSDLTRAVPKALAQANAEEERPPGLVKLMSTFWNKDFRRGLAAFNDLLVAFGRNLSRKRPQEGSVPSDIKLDISSNTRMRRRTQMKRTMVFANFAIGALLLGVTVSTEARAAAVSNTLEQSNTKSSTTHRPRKRSRVKRATRDVGKGTKDTGVDVAKGSERVGDDTAKGSKKVGQDVAKGSEDVAKETSTGAKDASKATAKGAAATGRATAKGARKVGSAFRKAGKKL